jgi:hypothetical protein
MNSLSDENRRRLLNAAKKIHANKQVQVIGFRALAEKTGDEKIRYLFKRIGDEEARLVEFWSKRIGDLGGAFSSRSLLRDWKAKLLMKVLGTKGFFEWALLGEEEGIEDLAIQVEKIRDMATSETWSRFASDERMRLERMRSEVLGMDEWRILGGSGVRDMALIFSGAYGGLVRPLPL